MVHKIVKSRYKPFVETLFLTLLILSVGFFIGFFLEAYRTNEIAEAYNEFEINALDLKLQNYYYQIMDESSCSKAIEENLIFADEIYNTGLLIEKYEETSDLSDEILLEKKKYVLLKTELWLNSILLKNKCENPFHTVVYLYSQEAGNAKKAEQDAISDILKELKEKRENDVILIPIAGDLGLDVVDMQERIYNIEYFPSIIIDETTVLEGFHSLEEIESYLGNSNESKEGVLKLN